MRASPGLVVRERREESELVAIGQPPAIDLDGREHRELAGDLGGRGGLVICAVRFEGGALEPGQRRSQLLVGAAVNAPPHGAQEGVKRERQRAVGGGTRLVKAPREFDVDVLVERTRNPLSGRGEHAPASAEVRREIDGRVVGGIAEPEERKRLE